LAENRRQNCFDYNRYREYIRGYCRRGMLRPPLPPSMPHFVFWKWFSISSIM